MPAYGYLALSPVPSCAPPYDALLFGPVLTGACHATTCVTASHVGCVGSGGEMDAVIAQVAAPTWRLDLYVDGACALPFTSGEFSSVATGGDVCLVTGVARWGVKTEGGVFAVATYDADDGTCGGPTGAGFNVSLSSAGACVSLGWNGVYGNLTAPVIPTTTLTTTAPPGTAAPGPAGTSRLQNIIQPLTTTTAAATITVIPDPPAPETWTYLVQTIHSYADGLCDAKTVTAVTATLVPNETCARSDCTIDPVRRVSISTDCADSPNPAAAFAAPATVYTRLTFPTGDCSGPASDIIASVEDAITCAPLTNVTSRRIYILNDGVHPATFNVETHNRVTCNQKRPPTAQTTLELTSCTDWTLMRVTEIPAPPCPETPTSPSTPAGNFADHKCPTGPATRARCSETGAWLPPDPPCPNTCAAVPPYPETAADATATAPCPFGNTISGKTSRACQHNATWAEPDDAGCAIPACPAASGLPVTPGGTFASAPCASGGTASGSCDVSGAWVGITGACEDPQSVPETTRPFLSLPPTATATLDAVEARALEKRCSAWWCR